MPAKPQRRASKRNYEGKSPETKTGGAIAGKEHCSSKELPEVFCSTVGYALLVHLKAQSHSKRAGFTKHPGWAPKEEITSMLANSAPPQEMFRFTRE